MLDISRKLKEQVDIKGKSYHLNLSFDNVIRLIEMISDNDISDLLKPSIALKMLVGTDPVELSENEKAEIVNDIIAEYIAPEKIETDEDGPVYDLAGNLMSEVHQKKTKRLYSLKHDGHYIYSAFLQAYNIDLFEVQGELHWKQFNALISSLPEETKFIEVIRIRSWEPKEGDSQDYISYMQMLQSEYRLPED